MDGRVIAVQRMQDYIGGHLSEEITLAELASAARFSPWYAHRLFREEMGLSPGEYIRKLRLSEAAKRLKSGKGRIIDVSLDLGFGSVDGFTRAFRREFAVKPSAYKTKPMPIALFVPYGAVSRRSRKEWSQMEPVSTVFVQLVSKPERKIILKRGIQADGYWEYCQEVGCDVWGTLLSMDSLCGEPVCLWLPERYIVPGTSRYVQGVEVDVGYAGDLPEGFDMITLPACEYLRFQGEPFGEEDYSGAIEVVQRAMDKYDPAVIGYKRVPDGFRVQLEPRGERGYIELMEVERTSE